MPARWSRRRTLTALAALPTASLAGCGSLQSNDDERREYTLHLERLDGSLADHLLWTPERIASPRDDLEATARRRAIENGRFTTYGFPAIDEDGEYTEYEGSYYRLSVVVTGQKPIDRRVLRLRWLGDEEDENVPAPDATVEDLPGLDRNAAMIAYFAARSRHDEGGGGPERMIERGGYVYRRETAEDSVLVPDPRYETLSVHGTVLRVEVSEERIPEPAYSVVATKLGESKRAYAEAVDAAQLDVRLSEADLSEAQRRIVQKATWDGGYQETTPLDDPFEALLDALDLNDVEGRIARKYLRYDGDDYEYELYVNPA